MTSTLKQVLSSRNQSRKCPDSSNRQFLSTLLKFASPSRDKHDDADDDDDDADDHDDDGGGDVMMILIVIATTFNGRQGHD